MDDLGTFYTYDDMIVLTLVLVHISQKEGRKKYRKEIW